MNNLKIYLVCTVLLLVNLTYANTSSQSFSVPTAADTTQQSDYVNMEVEELWDIANTEYANGNYIGAELAYKDILDRGVHSAELYYNLGNVHHKRGELAPSLLCYYRALRLSPSDSDILHNIEVVRAKTVDNIETMPRIFLVEWSEWIGARLSCMEWSILSILLFSLALGGLLLYLLSESLRLRRLGFGFTLLFGLLFVLSTRYALIERTELLNPSEAVVMSRSMSVKSSPNSASTELFILHEGTKVEVLTTHDTWCEVKIADGKRGWVESSRIERI